MTDKKISHIFISSR